MADFNTENNALMEGFLNRTFFNSFKVDNPNIGNLRSLEIQINSTCDLGCKYCYYTSFGKELYPTHISKNDNILKNLQMVLEWLRDNRMAPTLDIFTGEVFAQKIGRDVLELIYDFYKDTPEELRVPGILVPTNYTFILDPEKIDYTEDIIKRFAEIGIRISLSASFDGRALDSHNRPMKKVLASKGAVEDPRDDEYYENVFKFNARNGFGFHPMVYSNKIEEWPKNFEWFQENFEKHNIPWQNIYLLEVRNAEWTKQEMVDFGKFMRYLIRYAWEKCGEDVEEYLNFINNGRGFNILASPLSRIGRGIGCSIQSMIYLRLGDLSIVPCHRTMYPGFETAKLNVEDGKITGIKAINPELMIGTFQFHASSQPYCEDCAINSVCSKGCMGAQLEVMGDMFTPIPTVCELEHIKIYSMADEYRKMGILDDILKGRREIEEAWKATLRLYSPDQQEDF